jgi:hypothetical protein
MFDKNYKPWLIEVNQAPSFATDTPLDKSIKHPLIRDSFTLLGFLRNRSEMIPKHRLIEERERVEQEYDGMFTNIYTEADKRFYDKYIDAAQR